MEAMTGRRLPGVSGNVPCQVAGRHSWVGEGGEGQDWVGGGQAGQWFGLRKGVKVAGYAAAASYPTLRLKALHSFYLVLTL